MSSESEEEAIGDDEITVEGEKESFRKVVRKRLSERSEKVAQTKEILSKQAVHTKEILSKQAVKIAKQAEEHERFINKVTHLLGVLGFGAICFLLGARPQDIPYVYCLFYVTFVPLRWIYYRFKKWHYYLLDFCYYANTIFLVMLLFYPRNEKFFMVCFSFAEGPLAWALIVWRCSLVFSSVDKIVSVLIHLLPGIVFFTIRWWDPVTFAAMHPEGKASGIASWPYVEDKSYLWTWLFVVPLVAYTLWELSKKAKKANNLWWRLSGLLGDQNRMFMFILLQAVFTVATMALTVPIFMSYKMHVTFQILKVSASIWNGGSFLLEVMPRQEVLKEKKKLEMKPIPMQQQPDLSLVTDPLTHSDCQHA
ncbi:glycerophosphocholine acyltransferase 1-like isoform X2 [Magnolia sinica]|uniref:glycerophosphocholine acyltransferase 1-like isoform X2 n=1 Tax=Magnolia sinica TaxID=86752 RepID=UPI00265B3719|nr:glycerophosphocholine acyltransferase 1-like isoform X2 [Magnolia sinica]